MFRTIALCASLIVGTASAASAQSWPAMPFDAVDGHAGFEFVKRHNGANWYSERIGNDHERWSHFNLLRNSFTDGRLVEATIYEARCETGQVRALAQGAGRTFAEVLATTNWVGGPWRKPWAGTPEAIRLEQTCMVQSLINLPR